MITKTIAMTGKERIKGWCYFLENNVALINGDLRVSSKSTLGSYQMVYTHLLLLSKVQLDDIPYGYHSKVLARKLPVGKVLDF